MESVEAGGSTLVPYTSGSPFSPSPVRPTSASSAKQRAQLLYIPRAIKRSFLLLARYYSLRKSPPPSPTTSSVLNFLHSFIQINSNISLLPIAPRADIEERLLTDTICWAHARGLPFADPRLAIAQQSLQPVQQAALLPYQPVHQATGQSLQPVQQAALLPYQPVHQATGQSLQPVHQVPRRLQIEYDLPASVDAVPGSPGTVLIPLQVENSSKKRNVRLQLVRPVTIAPLPSEFRSISDELPDAPTDSPKLLTYPDTISTNNAAVKRRPRSPASSLDEFDDTPEQFSRPPLANRGSQSEVTRGKRPALPPHTHLPRHGYRQPLVIPESEDDSTMEDLLAQQYPTPPQQSLSPLQQYLAKPLQYQLQQPLRSISPPQQYAAQPLHHQQQPPQSFLPQQQYLAQPPHQRQQQGPQPNSQPPLQLPSQQHPQQYPTYQPPHQDFTATVAQSTAAMNDVARQMANLALTLTRNQTKVQAEGAGFHNTAANPRPPGEQYGPTLKPADVATFKPRSQSDSDAASRFIDCIRDAVAHYGDPRTRAVLRGCCKGPVAEDCIAGVSDHDRALLRMDCSNWTDILERDFMPYLASKLAAARAETFRWSQGRTLTEYVAKKLRLLRMADITEDIEVVEELHRGFAAAPNLHLHLAKYVSEVENSVSEYRRAVVRLQDSARRDGDTMASQPRIGTRRPPFRELTRVPSSNTGQRPAAAAITSARDAVAAPGAVTRTAPRKQPRERLRKCRNYPECGDGKHWDWQCIVKRTANNQVKRVYYAEHLDCEYDDGDDNVKGLLHDVLEPQADLD